MRRFLYMSAQLRKTNAPLDLEVIVKQKRMYIGVTLGFTCTWGALQVSKTLCTCSAGKEKNHDLLLLYAHCSIDHRHENLDTFQFEISLLVVE